MSDRRGDTISADPTPCVIVAVSASGASPRSLEFLLAHLPPQDRAALVVVLQHRDGLDEERLRLATAQGGRTLTPVADGAPVVPGRVYLPDPNLIVTVDGDRFRTRPADRAPGERGTIDSLLVSLARDEERRIVAVALAGTDGDGTLGVKTIKEAGGLALAEETEEVRTEELALSKSPAAIADAILPIGDLVDRLAFTIDQALRSPDGVAVAPPDASEVAAALNSIASVLRNKTGHDFHGYKPGTFLRRIQRRMQVVQTDRIDAYLEILRTRPDEAQSLFNDLLIGVTQFFRDAAEFGILEREVIPALFEGKTRTDQLRVWVIGCSTGEEAYSIAILLREQMADRDEVPQIQIFATDLDGRALAAARAGRYTDDIAATMPPERLARWFVKEGDTYCVVKELREMCIFSQHSIIKDAPFSRLDLVSCRNLLIYLEAELQSQVIPLFHFALRPGGFLFLGNSENVSRHTGLFAPIENRSRIFRRLETGTRTLPDFPFTAVDRRLVAAIPPIERPRAAEASLTRRAERFAERYAPAYVIVDEAYTVLHFSGRTGRYIDPAGGVATLNLLQLVHPDLRLDLRAALARAADHGRTVQAEGLRMGLNGHRLTVDLVVEPIQDGPGAAQSFFVLFKDGAVHAEEEEAGASVASAQTEHTQRLESELRATKDRLQATIEELESTNEELKSSNEEYQSLNEELQSANEELETSKEELQSVNEELTTVNGELAHRVNELTRATSDLKNFLESTQIATVFLDNELRVTNATPAVAEVFHLVDSDIGRPITHIKPRIAYDELQDDVRRVLRTLSTVEREIANPATGARYMVRVLPYRSVDNFIAGVVVTFVDITARQRAEEALRESEGQAKLLLAELQHRVRNTLAVLRSIVRRTAATSDTVEVFAAHLEGRIDAFARVQAAVTRDPAAGIDLEQLVSHELLAHVAHEGDQVRSIAGPSLRLRPKAAETLALAIHELATNAVKHGALSAPNGRIAVAWRINEGATPEPMLVLDWSETGVALSGEPPAHRGFGTELIERMLAYELGGNAALTFRPEGLHCRIAVPANDRVLVSRERA
ncbi:CheR family methyltransferase [Methylobacterium nodulans]|uniref:histidine kinase n=1 Tax=Methylobacterium nodulans (strain LMG 21967 / CNCM I-2342 / ORS 2060) TaxID=460265 RepID=B8IRC1_METNO|nr:CheR family methyltransferase [Methylobacterium nodulans]ACL58661.1 MCP methyltransferase/methylesterase, CheR/CheB with PAS/PAC sensor [Methylobacterium nodulans ORS 2060]